MEETSKNEQARREQNSNIPSLGEKVKISDSSEVEIGRIVESKFERTK